MTLAWHIAACIATTVFGYFGPSYVATGIIDWHHRRAVRRMRRYEVTFTPLQPGPPLPVISTTDRVTEQRVKQMEEEIKKLHAELHSRSDGHSNVTVTKRAGVPATTPHVDDDPKWRWVAGKWVMRTAEEVAERMASREEARIHAQKTRYIRPGEWASND